jgi:exosortase/archaeosortase family protein
MNKKEGKFLGIFVVFISLLIASIGSLSITNLSVLDTDPSTYIIVVLLMEFLFIIFSLKEDLEFKFSKKSIAIGLSLFAVYFVALSYLRTSLSFAFLSYRIDLLLLPLFLLSVIILVFGIDGIKKLWPVVVYSVFASPLLLLPLLRLNTAFANLNAELVYGFVKLFGVQASKFGLTIISGGSSIAISSTCVSIGTFIAFVMFLLPLAYLYNGKKSRKLYWIISGIVLILILNIIRMLLITFEWVYYGINGAVNTFHLFAGQIIFYIAIVLMLLIADKYYGLSMPLAKKSSRAKQKTSRNINNQIIYFVVGFCILISFFVLFLNLGYQNSIYAPAILFKNSININPIFIHQAVLSSVENSGSNVVVLGSLNGSDIFALSNSSGFNSSIFVLANVSSLPTSNWSGFNYNSLGPVHSYLLKNGITINSQKVSSANYTFEINYFMVPYNISGNWFTVEYFLLKKTNGNIQTCNLLESQQFPQLNFESGIYNILHSASYSTEGLMCQSYLIANSIR